MKNKGITMLETLITIVLSISLMLSIIFIISRTITKLEKDNEEIEFLCEVNKFNEIFSLSTTFRDFIKDHHAIIQSNDYGWQIMKENIIILNYNMLTKTISNESSIHIFKIINNITFEINSKYVIFNLKYEKGDKKLVYKW